MKAYKYGKSWKIETKNCIVIIQDDLTDIKGRQVTSVQIIPDKYIGEPVHKVVPKIHNIRIITLKKKN